MQAIIRQEIKKKSTPMCSPHGIKLAYSLSYYQFITSTLSQQGCALTAFCITLLLLNRIISTLSVSFLVYPDQEELFAVT
jgi:hypothetical protein